MVIVGVLQTKVKPQDEKILKGCVGLSNILDSELGRRTVV